MILNGDCRDVLPTLPERSVHCVVASPPYWGLRDYGHAEQIGLESTPEEYVANMVAVFRKVRRVLRDDGTVWLNLGDSYGNPSAGRNDTDHMADGRPGGMSSKHEGTTKHTANTVKPKDLVGIPWRVAFALQADGWYLRSDIIWSKPNPMPESVTDRPTKSHEYVFLLSKSQRYYFDQEAVREPHTATIGPRRDNGEGDRFVDLGMYSGRVGNPEAGRNIRSVWTIATQPYPGAHFATFPPALVEPCVKAGTSERGVCAECGAPWVRVTKVDHEARSGNDHADDLKHGAGGTPGNGRFRKQQWLERQAATREEKWMRSCAHQGDQSVPATVLDPFGGSGTVGMVAEKLSRGAILIELNPEYVELAEERTAQKGLGL